MRREVRPRPLRAICGATIPDAGAVHRPAARRRGCSHSGPGLQPIDGAREVLVNRPITARQLPSTWVDQSGHDRPLTRARHLTGPTSGHRPVTACGPPPKQSIWRGRTPLPSSCEASARSGQFPRQPFHKLDNGVAALVSTIGYRSNLPDAFRIARSRFLRMSIPIYFLLVLRVPGFSAPAGSHSH